MYSGLSEFVTSLERENELIRIRAFADPVLEIAEIADRVVKSGGKALLFENNGTDFPLLINAFGSDRRMAMAMGRKSLDDAADETGRLFSELTVSRSSFREKLKSLPLLLRLRASMPSRTRGRGLCQQVIHRDPDLGMLPVLKCWPYDGGRFLTLPVVHTVHPLTGKTNAGMYRMQVLDKNSTAMHWQRHKTGASHFEEWKKTGRKMPVAVSLGGDPVYTYAATAPLPENIDEFILASFLRGKKTRLVKCITNDLYVPADADIVIEGWIDPSEDPVWEGPFGDHTGFYSLADWYPVFRVSCITHRKDAVYPATIVGIPPQEDAWLTKASEKIFLAPLKFAIQPEIEDFHMPDAGVAHNLAIVKIRKTYPGQGKKVISALLGAGQMMFTKYLAVVSGDVDIRNYTQLLGHVLDNTVFRRDLLFSQGPLDVLDHASDLPLLGGKLGIDATVKTGEELTTDPSDEFLSQYNIPDGKGNNRQANAENSSGSSPQVSYQHIRNEVLRKCRNACSSFALLEGYPVLVAGTGQYDDPDALKKLKEVFSEPDMKSVFRLVLAVDDRLDVKDWFTIVWQILGNTDPGRDIIFLSDNSILADGTAKIFGKRAFKRKWPNIVCSSESTIRSVDMKWGKLGLGPFIHSPSEKNSGMNFGEGAEVNPREITKGRKDKE